MSTNIFFAFGERILPDYTIRHVGLYNSLSWPLKVRCCVFNKVCIVKHWRDIHDCSSKCLCLSNSYRNLIMTLSEHLTVTSPLMLSIMHGR